MNHTRIIMYEWQILIAVCFFFPDAFGVWRWGSTCRWAVDGLYFICRCLYILYFHNRYTYRNVCMTGLNCCMFFFSSHVGFAARALYVDGLHFICRCLYILYFHNWYTYRNVCMIGLNCYESLFFDAFGVWHWGSIWRWAAFYMYVPVYIIFSSLIHVS